MKRTIQYRVHPASVEALTVESLDHVELWLQGMAVANKLSWLLAHADDGVIWGRRDHDCLITSATVAPHVSPPLRLATLQCARLFASHAELLLWRDGENAWHARLIRDTHSSAGATWQDTMDEPYLLWGTDTQKLTQGFTLMTDGAQGLRHAVPIPVRGTYDEEHRPLRLWVRHYLQEEPTGFTRIATSRLVNVENVA